MKDDQKKKTAVEEPRRFQVRKRERIPVLREPLEQSLWERLYERLTGGRELEGSLGRGRERWKALGVLAASFLLSLLMSLASLSFSTYPVGFALVCAVGSRRRAVSFLNQSAFCAAVVAGVLFGCLFVDSYPFLHFALYCAVFLVRVAMTSGVLDEGLVTKSALSTFAAALCGLTRGVLEGFTLPSLFMLVSLTVLTPVICYLLSGFYADGEEEGGAVPFECACLGAAVAALFALQELSFFGFRPAFVAGLVFTFGVARYRGPIYGAVAGLAAGLSCGTPLYGAVMGLSGFFSGLFFPLSQPMALMLSFVISAGFCVFGAGFASFGAVSDDFVAAACLYYPLRSFFQKGEPKAARLSEVAGYREEEGLKRAEQRLERLSDAFCSLSRVFYTVSEKAKAPDLTEVTALVSDCCSCLCSACPRSEDCWGRDYGATREESFRLSRALMQKGQVTGEELSEEFCSRCLRRRELLESVNEAFRQLCSRCFRENRAELLAGEYSTVSRLLKSTAGEFAGELRPCPDLEQRSARVLKRLGMEYSRLSVFGRREMKIDCFGVFPDAVRHSAERIREEFEKEFSCRFEEPAFLLLEQRAVMRLQKRRRIVLECAKACRAKNGESVNGDTAGFFESDADRFYSMICDGMGCGRDAAITSRLAQLFIEKLLSCSSPGGLTLELLNSFLLAKNNECFTTVDLLEVDLLSGEGSFVKAGAAPSFVLRGENLFRVASRTPPAGILPQMAAERTALELRAGDVVVMLSDGIAPNEAAESRLCQSIVLAENRAPAALAAALLQEAASAEHPDDMTVFVLAVKEA